MSTPLIKKLRINQDLKTLVINAPAGYLEMLEGIRLDTKAKGKYDFVQIFIKNSGEWEELGVNAIEAIHFDAIFWVCYPKKSSKMKSDLSRDKMWELIGKDSGMRPVSQIAIDETWSALRFRPSEKVGK